MTTKIALIGAAGKMGKEIILAAQNEPSAQIAYAVEHEKSKFLGTDIAKIAGLNETGVLITSKMPDAKDKIDVIIDVSSPLATLSVINSAISASIPLVCGTTGIEEPVLNEFSKASKNIPVIHTKNFSVGIATLASLAAKAAAILGPNYDIEIIEKHHRLKVDAPSGTAQILGDAIKENVTNSQNKFVYGRFGNTGARTMGEIGIHAIRCGGIFGEHTVIFASENERLEFTHKAETRSLFAQGAIRTAIFIAQAQPGLYTMKDVLGLEK